MPIICIASSSTGSLRICFPFMMHGVLDVLVVAAIDDAGGHHVLGLDIGNALVVGHTTDGNVPIGDHADEGAVGGDRNAADIELAHSLGDGSDLGLGRNAFETLMHHVFHFHGQLLFRKRGL